MLTFFALLYANLAINKNCIQLSYLKLKKA